MKAKGLTKLSYEEKYLQKVDSDYGFSIAKKLLEFKTNSNGFRLAGTPAENAAADWIFQEMKHIGLAEVAKESLPVDAWEFKGAQVTVISPKERFTTMEAGSFSGLQGTLSEGITSEVIYVGDGTKQNYEGLNVEDKIVLIDTDAYHTYWYNMVFEQAEAKGAKAIIATVVGAGPGTYNDNLITIQDIQGFVNIPAVMMTKRDGDQLRTLLKDNTPLTVNINVDVRITHNAEAHYVYGKIIGKNPDRYIIVGGHYDAYWDGFLDNASSLGSQLTIAKAMIDSGYQPESTIIFITNGAEEYGMANTYFDYCTGTDAIIKNHPEWVSNTIIYNNFEVTAIRETERFSVVGSSCYGKIISELFERVDLPAEFHFIPISCSGADHAVFHKAGISSYMNASVKFGSDDPESMENYDHTQYDNAERYDADAFDCNNKVFGLINIAFDKLLTVPIDFTSCTADYWDDVDQQTLKVLYPRFTEMDNIIKEFNEKANVTYELQIQTNHLLRIPTKQDRSESALQNLYNMAWKENLALLKINKLFQDKIYKFDAFTSVIIGHMQPYSYVTVIDALIKELKSGNAGDSLQALEGIDYNYLIQNFDKEVYEKTAIKAFDPSAVLQSWGAGETLPFPNLYDVITSIHEKQQKGVNDFKQEIAVLQRIRDEQHKILVQTLDNELDAIQSANEILNGMKLQDIIDTEDV